MHVRQRPFCIIAAILTAATACQETATQPDRMMAVPSQLAADYTPEYEDLYAYNGDLYPATTSQQAEIFD
jgi:hypothetical protein